MAFTDFPNGLGGAADYLSANNSTRAELTGSVADIGRLVVSAELDFNLKEIICSLLAGRGLKLPNIQICISLNLKELLGTIFGQVQQVLYDALASLDAAFDRFLDHLKLDEVLGRINNVLGEVTQIANMINFCSAPLDPIQIPNVLENAMDSFLGAGKSIIDSIGQILPGEIGGCLIDGQFNGSIFNGGILKKIWDNFDDLDTIADTIINDANSVIRQIDDLIDRENNVSGVYDQGGSDLLEDDDRPVNDGIGALYNSQDEGIQGAVYAAGQLWSSYQNLASYQVVGSDGTVYNNIFETFCEPELLRILRRTPDPRPEIAEREPVFNYCGEIIGYTKVTTQESPTTSVGKVPGEIDQPGFDAGGLSTSPIAEAIEIAATGSGSSTSGDTTIINNIDGTGVLFAESEAAQLSLGTTEGQLVYRTDTGTTYVDNGGTSNTISDFNVVGGASGANVGAGSQVYAGLSGQELQFRTITSGEYINLTQTLNEIEVSADIARYEGTLLTTDATLTEVLFDTVPNPTPGTNTTWFLTITAVANRRNTNDAVAIRMETVIDNATGTVSVVGVGGNKTVYNASAATANYDLVVDVSSNQTRVRVQGDTAHNVDWKVRMEYIASP